MAHADGTGSGTGSGTRSFLTPVGVNWRQLYPDGSLPPLPSCQLCGIVPDVAFVLECPDGFCKLCYEMFIRSYRTCPVDKGRFETEAVSSSFQWKTGQPPRPLSMCYNWSHGCSFVGTVQETLHHTVNDCAFHVVRCVRCNTNVLRANIFYHYDYGCRGRLLSPEPLRTRMSAGGARAWGHGQRNLEPVTGTRSSLQDGIDSVRATVLATAIKLRAVNDFIARELNRPLHSQVGSHASEAAKSEQTLGSISEIREHEIPAEYWLKTKISALRLQADTNAAIAYQQVGNLRELQVYATVLRRVSRLSDPFVVGGYTVFLLTHVWVGCIEFYLAIRRDSEHVCQPFTKKLSLVLLHPQCEPRTVRKRLRVSPPLVESVFVDHYGSELPAGVYSISGTGVIGLEWLESRGFIHDDAIWLAVKLA